MEYRVPQMRVSADAMVKQASGCGYKPEVFPELKAWLKANPHLPPISEEQLIMFAHSCYYDLARTKDCIDMYYSLQSTTPDFFNKRDLNQPELKHALSVLDYACFPEKTPEGYQIVFHRLHPGQYEPSKYVFADGVKLLNMTMEALMCLDGPQSGYYILFDMNGVRLGHLTRLSISLLKKFFTYIQEANPIRLKGIFVINTLPILDKIMVLIKPFMKKELLSLLHFYTASEAEKLYQFIPKECLPSDFGGALKPVSEHHADNTERMTSLKQYWLDQETMRIDEKKRPSKSKKKASQEPVPDIRRLELD